MLTETDLHIISGMSIFVAAFVSIYLSLMLKGNLRKLTSILSIFILIHTAFHVTGALGMDFVAEKIFEPLSYAVLIFFGLFYLTLKKKANKEIAKNG